VRHHLHSMITDAKCYPSRAAVSLRDHLQVFRRPFLTAQVLALL